jgi:hypothetical protein
LVRKSNGTLVSVFESCNECHWSVVVNCVYCSRWRGCCEAPDVPLCQVGELCQTAGADVRG